MKAKRTNQPLSPVLSKELMSTLKQWESPPPIPAHRRCRRCGCTQRRACPGGCSWVGATSICTRCLTPAEHSLWQALRGEVMQKEENYQLAKVDYDHALSQILNFELILMQKPLQRRKRHA